MSQKKFPISVRFVGEQFSGRKGVPIYELGESLISIQRLVNRAYLLVAPSVALRRSPVVRQGQKNIRNPETLQQFALQIAERSQGSDMYALSWFAQAATASAPVINAILVELAGVAGAYLAKRIFDGPRENPTFVNVHASALYYEFANLANRLRRVGEIEEIQIKFAGQRKPVVINSRFKKYIDDLEGLEYPGEWQTISGTVMTAHVQPKKSVDIITSTHRHVRVWVSWQAFHSILKALDKYDNPMFEFDGTPTLKMGDGPWEFRELEAEHVRTIPSHLRHPRALAARRGKKARKTGS